MKTPTQFNNILIIRTDRIGDVVLTTPAIKALRQAYPLARLTVMVSPGTVDLVEGNPYVDEILVDERQGRHQDLFGFLKLAQDMRCRQFDLAIILHTKRRYNLACFLAGVPVRLGYKNNKCGVLLTRPLLDQRHLGQKHEAQYCLDVLSAIGVNSDRMDLFVPEQKQAEMWVLQWMTQWGLKPNEMIAIHPGASDPTKCWPAKNFAALVDRLVERYELKVVLIGGPASVGLAGDILRQARLAHQFIDMTSQTSMAQTVSLLRRCRLLISNDSGPVHVAAGVGIFVISLFLRTQPGINPQRWKPLGPKSFVLTNKPTQEILLDAQGKVKSGQLDSITVDEVLAQVEDIFLKDNQPSFYWTL